MAYPYISISSSLSHLYGYLIFLDVTFRVVLSRWQDFIEFYPEGLNDFAFQKTDAWNEAGCKLGEAFVLMAIDVKQSYSMEKPHML